MDACDPSVSAECAAAELVAELPSPQCTSEKDLVAELPPDPAKVFPVRHVMVRGGPRAMRVVCISDTHSMHCEIPLAAVPEGDVFIHCGDFSKKGKADEAASFNAFVEALPHAAKFVIGGNHDVGPFCEFESRKSGEMLPSVRYLDNELVEVDGLKIYGTPWNRRGNRAIPEGLDVLVTHEPPSGILDNGRGCEYLRAEVDRAEPLLHVFGHIHEASGSEANGRTMFVNAALANDGMVSKCLDKPMFVIDFDGQDSNR